MLIDSGKLDDALALVDNRERALNLLASRADVTAADATILQEVDKLNTQLLEKFLEVRENLQRDIATQHKQGTAHRAYQSTQVK